MGTGAAKANLWWHRVKSGFGEVEALALESGFVTFPPAVLLGTPAGGTHLWRSSGGTVHVILASAQSLGSQGWPGALRWGLAFSGVTMPQGTEAGPGVFRSQHDLLRSLIATYSF